MFLANQSSNQRSNFNFIANRSSNRRYSSNVKANQRSCSNCMASKRFSSNFQSNKGYNNYMIASTCSNQTKIGSHFFCINLQVRLNLGCILKISCLVTLETLDFGEVVVIVVIVVVIPRENKVQLQPSWQDKSYLSSFPLVWSGLGV